MLLLFSVGEARFGLDVRHVLGLLAEHVTETGKFDKSAFISSGRGAQSAEFLGELAMDEKGMVQCIRMDKLLPTDVRDALFKPIGDAGAAAGTARCRCAPSKVFCSKPSASTASPSATTRCSAR